MSIPVVEFIGPPGSGKTTLLNSVVSRGGVKRRSVILGKKTSLKQPRRFFRQIPRLAFGLSVRHRALERFFLKKNQNLKYDPNLEASSEDWLSFVQYSLGLIQYQNSPWLLKTLVATWWADTFVDRLRLDSSEHEGMICLDDEPLSYRLSLFNGINDDSVIRKYYELMPLPAAVVHLFACEDDLIYRIKSRERVAARHKGLEDSELLEDVAFSANVANIANEILGARGVPVLELDGLASLSENVTSVLAFLEGIAGNDSPAAIHSAGAQSYGT